MSLEKKIQLNYIENGSGIHGAFVLRMITKESIIPETALTMVTNHLKAFVTTIHGDTTRKQKFLNDIDRFGQLPIVYHKVDTYQIEGDQWYTVYYNQLVLDIPADLQETNPMRNGPLSDILNIIHNMDNTRYEDWIQVEQSLNYAYSIGILRPNIYRGWGGITSHDPIINNFIDKYYNAHNHLAFTFDIENNTNIRNRNSYVRYSINIFNNLKEAFAARNSHTYCITCGDNDLGSFMFQEFKTNMNGITRVYNFAPKKIGVEWVNNILVFYDGQKAFDTVKDYIAQWQNYNIRQVNVLQYCDLRNFFVQQMPIGRPALTLNFVNKNNINVLNRTFSIGDVGFRGNVNYKPATKRKTVHLETMLSYNAHDYDRVMTYGNIVLPVNDKNDHIKALEELNQMLSCLYTHQSESFKNHCRAYIDLLKSIITVQEDDILSRWFQYCTQASKNTDDKIVRAYKAMKDKLEKEYKDIGAYLDHYDFSKCLPVPAINLDDKMVKNYYKTLHIEPINTIIKSINNRKIQQSIAEMKSMVTVQMILKGEDVYMAQYPLIDFYNSKNNSLILDYKKMKGAIIRDKIKNRR